MPLGKEWSRVTATRSAYEACAISLGVAQALMDLSIFVAFEGAQNDRYDKIVTAEDPDSVDENGLEKEQFLRPVSA
jgi:hypothetical protein